MREIIESGLPLSFIQKKENGIFIMSLSRLKTIFWMMLHAEYVVV